MDNTSLSFWLEHVADIPERDENGLWYDLETGISFKTYLESLEPERSPRRSISDDAAKARKQVRDAYGASALTGSIRQKNWAEGIRLRMCSTLSIEDAKELLEWNLTNSCKFWIENRKSTAVELLHVKRRAMEAGGLYIAARNANDSAAIEKYANLYNSITESLGFK